MRQIDHDPRELSRRALKVVAIVSITLTIAVMIVFGIGWRWAIDQMPKTMVAVLAGLGMGLCGGYFIGVWDAKRQLRTPGND